MKLVTAFALMTLTVNAFGKGKLEVVPLNSPIKESHAKFALKGFDDISKVFFKSKTAREEFEGALEKTSAGFIGKFRASPLPPGKYEFRVRVTTNSGKSDKDEAKSVAFVIFNVDPSLEVADPGPAGEKTLLGIDSDSNGIRDDVQRWINEQKITKNHKNALKLIADRYQKDIASSADKEASIEASKKVLDGVGCLLFVLDRNHSIVNRWVKDLEVKVFNTKERLMAEDKSAQHFNGASNSIYNPRSVPNDQKCNFNLE